MVPRTRYETRIRTALRRSKIVALLGPRQCGKTTLAQRVASDIDSQYFDLESPADRARLRNPELYLGELSGLIVLDEIQTMPELFPVLRVLADRSVGNGRFLILGSASGRLVHDASESLAGRIEFVDLQGFAINETGTERDSMRALWIRGGFPRAFLAESEEDSLAWREGFIRTFLQRDLPQFGVNVPESTMRRFWTMLAHSHGQVLNSSRLAASMGLSDKTIRSYVDILGDTYMVRQLQPWYENLGKRQVKSPKIYLTDTGLLHRLLGVDDYDSLLGHPQIGVSWESFVIEQILRNTAASDAYFWSTYSGGEIDLLLVRGGQRIGIECKYTESPATTKSMHVVLADLQLDALYVAYPGIEPYPLTDRILVRSVPDLLAELGS